MQVIVADKAGFCSGVSRAIEQLLERAAPGEKIFTLGPLVHNEETIEYLEKQSITAVDDPEKATGAILAIRTHGISPGMHKKLEDFDNTEIIDLTCPRVRRVQKTAARLREKGYQVVIFGDTEHPEVQALIGWAGKDTVVVSSLDELEQIELKAPSGLIAQTTADPGLYEQFKALFKKKMPGGQIHDTLCPETKLRQEEIYNLASRVNALVVVGSESSANTKALYDCCRQLKPSCRINKAGELSPSFLKLYRVFGVTGGASTPPWTIKEVVEKMENENLDVKNEEQFDFDVEVKVAQVGEQVTGKIARVTAEEVYVDIGTKTEAVLPVTEVHLDQGQELADLFAPEDDIEVTVMDTDEQEGKVVVSHKRLARDKRLKEVERAHAADDVLEGKVKQVVSAGLIIDLGSSVEGFMPGSLVDIKFIPDFIEFKDQQLQFKVLEFDREKGKIILSRKKILEEEASRKREETLKSLEVGSTVTGIVKRLTNFGAFVDVGNIDGLVHISELSWERVGHPSEILSNGDRIEVKVMEVIPEKERISLSIRQTQPDPWTKAVEQLESGQLITGKVTRLVNFGAFIEIKPGIEGLAHISQLADYHVKHPSEVLSEGEELEVKILEVKPKAKRISLSVKEARGVKTVSNSSEPEETKNGSVTLGDVFGDLFNGEEPEEAEKDPGEASAGEAAPAETAASEEAPAEVAPGGEQQAAEEDEEEDDDDEEEENEGEREKGEPEMEQDEEEEIESEQEDEQEKEGE